MSSSTEMIPAGFPTTHGGFRTILVAPPWSSGAPDSAPRRSPYLDELAALPVAETAATDAQLFLQVPNELLPEGIDLMRSWGFRYVSSSVRIPAPTPCHSDAPSLLLSGLRGSPATLSPHTLPGVVPGTRADNGITAECLDLIEASSPGPYLGLFTRTRRKGWTTWNASPEHSTRTCPANLRDRIAALPKLRPNERMSAPLLDRAAEILSEEYNQGASLQTLAASSGYSITRVRSLLARSGVEFRRCGRPRKTHHAGHDAETLVSGQQ